jgi:phage anti-repressor protein
VVSIQPFSFELAQNLYVSKEEFPVDFDFAVEWLGYSRKDSAKRALVKSFVINVDYRLHQVVESAPGGGLTHFDKIQLSANCLKEMGMLAQTEKGKQVRQYFLKCEEIAKKAIAVIDSASSITDLDVVANLATMMGGLAKGIQASTNDIKRTIASGEVVVVSEVRHAAHSQSEDNKAILAKLDRLIDSQQVPINVQPKPERCNRAITFHCETEEEYQEFLNLADSSGLSRSKFFLYTNREALGVNNGF